MSTGRGARAFVWMVVDGDTIGYLYLPTVAGARNRCGNRRTKVLPKPEILVPVQLGFIWWFQSSRQGNTAGCHSMRLVRRIIFQRYAVVDTLYISVDAWHRIRPLDGPIVCH